MGVFLLENVWMIRLIQNDFLPDCIENNRRKEGIHDLSKIKNEIKYSGSSMKCDEPLPF